MVVPLKPSGHGLEVAVLLSGLAQVLSAVTTMVPVVHRLKQ